MKQPLWQCAGSYAKASACAELKFGTQQAFDTCHTHMTDRTSCAHDLSQLWGVACCDTVQCLRWSLHAEMHQEQLLSASPASVFACWPSALLCTPSAAQVSHLGQVPYCLFICPKAGFTNCLDHRRESWVSKHGHMTCSRTYIKHTTPLLRGLPSLLRGLPSLLTESSPQPLNHKQDPDNPASALL